MRLTANLFLYLLMLLGIDGWYIGGARKIEKRIPRQLGNAPAIGKRPGCSPPRKRDAFAAGQTDQTNALMGTRDVLKKRMTEPTALEGIDNFFDRELGLGMFLPRGVVDLIKPDYDLVEDDDFSDRGTAIFRPLGNEAFSIGARGVTGCTVLFVFTHHACYMTHWWETISFWPDADWIEQYGDRDQAFQQTVLDPLRGVGATPGIHDSLSDKIAQFKGPNPAPGSIQDVMIRLIRPDYPTTDGIANGLSEDERAEEIRRRWAHYVAKWAMIEETVTGYFEGQGFNVNYDEIANDSDAVENEEAPGADGKILFKYDPMHRIPGSSPPRRVRKANLWAFRSNDIQPRFTDQW